MQATIMGLGLRVEGLERMEKNMETTRDGLKCGLICGSIPSFLANQM